MHLTNYAINKDSANFVENKEVNGVEIGTKRSLISIFELIEQDFGYDALKTLKEKIYDIILKTMCMV
jgi:hypothetical protein